MARFSAEEQWEALEKIGAYAAGELEAEEAREVEGMILESEDHRRLAESYARLMATLSMLGQDQDEVVAPDAVVNYAIRRVYISAFLRQAEQFAKGLAGDYLRALALYLNLYPGQGRA